MKIAVVTLEKRDPVLQPRLAHALFGEAVLLIGNCGGGHAAAVLARGVDCQRAPARADLQQVVRRAQVELAASPVDLLDLRLLERGGAVLKDSARIGHRGIEEQREELVTKVVVGDDVAPATRSRVPLQPVGRARQGGAQSREWSFQRVHRRHVHGHDFDQGGQVVGLPRAIDVGLGDAEAATERGRRVEARIENAHGYERKRAGLSRKLRFVRALVVDEPDIALRNTRERGKNEASAERFKQARSLNGCVCGAIADGRACEVSGWA